MICHYSYFKINLRVKKFFAIYLALAMVYPNVHFVFSLSEVIFPLCTSKFQKLLLWMYPNLSNYVQSGSKKWLFLFFGNRQFIFLKMSPLGVILWEKSIASILEVWKRFPGSRKNWFWSENGYFCFSHFSGNHSSRGNFMQEIECTCFRSIKNDSLIQKMTIFTFSI